jgi:Putative transmembrane protein (PGPGW)
VKKAASALIGGTLLLIGLALLVLPGPGLLIVAVGLGILASEFLWARRMLRRAKGAAARVRRKSGIRAWLRGREMRQRHPDDLDAADTTHEP